MCRKLKKSVLQVLIFSNFYAKMLHRPENAYSPCFLWWIYPSSAPSAKLYSNPNYYCNQWQRDVNRMECASLYCKTELVLNSYFLRGKIWNSFFFVIYIIINSLTIITLPINQSMLLENCKSCYNNLVILWKPIQVVSIIHRKKPIFSIKVLGQRKISKKMF